MEIMLRFSNTDALFLMGKVIINKVMKLNCVFCFLILLFSILLQLLVSFFYLFLVLFAFTLKLVYCETGYFFNFDFRENILIKSPHVVYPKKSPFFLYNLQKKSNRYHQFYAHRVLSKTFHQKKTPCIFVFRGFVGL